MSSSKELRQFLLDQGDITIDQVSQDFIPEEYTADDGFIFIAKRSTTHARTFSQPATAIPDSEFFDIEVYHSDPDVVETHSNAIQELDCYTGTFGTGRVQGVFVENQSDDYVPRVQFTDEVIFHTSFLSLEIRAFSE